ncbi:hypothetical protein GCM10022408_27290 [Hymenobacter fastidiosus]|uniref:Curlin n=1 Tax=Hymenobacter fastidiosus TaxID=486264 RepID=A0ABP7SKH0_9BACT
MKKICVYSLTVLLGLSSAYVSAQTQSKEPKEEISKEQRLVERFGTEQLNSLPESSIDRSILAQQGNNNAATIDQRLLGIQGNTAVVLQLGNTNVVNATQTGAGNSTTVKQVGNRNHVTSDINGYETESFILQDGSYNKITQELNVDERRYKVQQQGNNNQLTQRENGAAAPPGYEIHMKGNGIKMTIEQGKVGP